MGKKAFKAALARQGSMMLTPPERAKYDESEPRDDHGRWAGGGTTGASAPVIVRDDPHANLWDIPERGGVEALRITRRGPWYTIRHYGSGETERVKGAKGVAEAVRLYGVTPDDLHKVGIG